MEKAALEIVLSESTPTGTPGQPSSPGQSGADVRSVAEEVGKLRELLDRRFGHGGGSGIADDGLATAAASGLGQLFAEVGSAARRAGFPNVGSVIQQGGKLFGSDPIVQATRTTAADAAGLESVELAGPGAAVGALGAAAGPLALAEGISRLAAGTINTAANSIKAAGEAAQRLAGNDGLGALLGASEHVASGLEEIPIAGRVWAAEIRAVTGTITTFRDTVEAFVQRGRQLAPFSSELTQAGVTAEIRSLMDDIRESQEIGPDIAKLTDAQSRLQHEVRELILPIRKAIVETLVPVVEKMASRLEENRPTLFAIGETVKTTAEAVVSFFALGPQAAKGIMDQLPERMAKAIVAAIKGGDDPAAAIDAAIQDLLKQEGTVFGPVFDPVKAAGQQGLNVPLFG